MLKQDNKEPPKALDFDVPDGCMSVTMEWLWKHPVDATDIKTWHSACSIADGIGWKVKTLRNYLPVMVARGFVERRVDKGYRADMFFYRLAPGYEACVWKKGRMVSSPGKKSKVAQPLVPSPATSKRLRAIDDPVVLEPNIAGQSFSHMSQFSRDDSAPSSTDQEPQQVSHGVSNVYDEDDAGPWLKDLDRETLKGVIQRLRASIFLAQEVLCQLESAQGEPWH